ncbi:MAG: hypothetical protein E6R03_14190 [Hyphomicrobiaceae bacterium]|nr:MAG: hypothetical protein E6R03_14190 [Hyphomicrobiaceae bacterium]
MFDTLKTASQDGAQTKADADQRLSVKQKIVGKRPPREDSAEIHHAVVVNTSQAFNQMISHTAELAEAGFEPAVS